VAHAWVWAVVSLGVIIAVASFAPLPGYYDVQVSVTAGELALIFTTVFWIQSVNSHVTGQSTILDWGGLLGIGPPALTATFTMTVCLGSSHCTSKSENQWFPSIPIINGGSLTATTNFELGYIPAGNYPISVTLTQSGSSVATGSGSICVGGGC
jgi:hypothetical protein